MPLPQSVWMDLAVNRIFTAAVTAACFLSLGIYIDLLGALRNAAARGRRAVELEHNLQTARERNLCAAVITGAYALICDRFGLFPARFMESVPPGWSICVCAALIGAYLGIRRLLLSCILPRTLHPDEKAAAYHCTVNILCLSLPVFLLTAALGHLFAESAVRTALYAEGLAVILLSTYRCREILSFHCGGFATILYLCAAELPPVGLLVAAAYFL